MKPITPDLTRRLITGGTGFMGSHFLLGIHTQALHSTVLTRGKNQSDASARLERAIETAAYAQSVSMNLPLLQERVKAVVGDICNESCGLSAHAASDLAASGIQEFWHFAASLQFEQRSRDSIFSHNLTGTRNALALAIRLGCKRFVYVSTAYTAGIASGPIAEELHDKTGPFNNLYEESKCMAEHEVAETCMQHAIDFRILRPSIVVGPSTTLCTGGSDTGLYGFARELYRLRGQFERITHGITVQGDPSTPLNLIPIDWVVQDLLHLVQTRFVGVGPVLHLTAPGGLAIELIGETISRHAKTPCFRIVHEMPEKPSPIELIFDRRTSFYGGYLKGAKEFLRSLPAHPAVSYEQVNGYIREFYKELTGAARTQVFDRSVLASFDGTPLCTYSVSAACMSGARHLDRPALVLVNAYGMPVDLMSSLARALANQFRVLTWESRGVPNLEAPFDAKAVTVGHHAKDLGALLDAYQINSAHVLGWCTGAQVALRFATENPSRVKKLVLLHGVFALSEDSQISEYRELIRELMAEVSENPALAEFYYQLIYGDGSKAQAAGSLGDVNTVSAVLDFTDPELLYLTSAPFQSAEALYRYATLVARFNDEPSHAWTPGVRAPTLLVSGELDLIAHTAETFSVARRLHDSETIVLPQGTHFSLHHDGSLPKRISEFLLRAQAGTAGGRLQPQPDLVNADLVPQASLV